MAQSPAGDNTPPVRRFQPAAGGFRWHGIPRRAYKSAGAHFRAIQRQTLFDEPDQLGVQVRYFEIGPGGYSTLERHHHVHAVLILHGKGRVLVGDELFPVAAFDLVSVPSMVWHQFQADSEEALGFLCLVRCTRDRPLRPTAEELEKLRSDPALARVIRP
jgi:quercetin dioxygenase-like cupin family protein